MQYKAASKFNYFDKAIDTALKIHETEPPGDILVFLTGQGEIKTAGKILKEQNSDLIICPIYANLPTEIQAKIFEPAPQGARKVVLATNIAEASLTIDGIKYVIDSGFCKIHSYSPHTGMESLLIKRISKASAVQRAGRAGRTGPGKCYRLYTAYTFENEMAEDTKPKILRTHLAKAVLTLKSLGVNDLLHFDFMDPPTAEALLEAEKLLLALNALNEEYELTEIGKQMARFPLDPMMSKAIIASCQFNCSEEMICIAAMLSVGNCIFYIPKAKEIEADKARLKFHAGNVGDHIALLKVYRSWKESKYSKKLCHGNYVQVSSMMRARNIRDQLEQILERAGFEIKSNPNKLEPIKKAILSGYFPNYSTRNDNLRSYKRVKLPQTVHLHPSSGLAGMPKCVVFHELLFTTKEYIWQVTEIKPEWLLEIAPHYYPLQTSDRPYSEPHEPALRSEPLGITTVEKILTHLEENMAVHSTPVHGLVKFVKIMA